MKAIAFLVNVLYLIFMIYTGIVSWSLNKSVLWVIIDVVLAPLIWIKWMYYGDV